MSNIKPIIVPSLMLALWGLFYFILDQKFSTPHSDIQTHIIQGVLTVIWLTIGFIINRLIKVLIWDSIIEPLVARTPPKLLIQLGNFIIYLIIISVIIGVVFEQPVTSFWTASGALGVVIGLALRNLIMDTFSGLALQMERPFYTGDLITVYARNGEFTGRVEDTNWRSTRLWRADRSRIVIPNSLITTSVMVNLDNPDPVGHFELKFTLDYKVPSDKAVRVITAALIESIGNKGPLADPAPKVRIDSIGEYGIVYLASYYIAPTDVSPSKARNTIYHNVLKHLKRAGITLANPKQDIFMARMPWRHEDWDYGKDRSRLLGRIDVFKSLSAEEHDFLADQAKIIEVSKGETIITQGDQGSSMFVLGEGMLDVMINDDKSDEQIKVARLTPGAFFGEKSLLTGERRSASIVSVTESILCEIDAESMKQLFNEKPQVMQTLSKEVIQRDMKNKSQFNNVSRKEQDQFIAAETDSFMSKLTRFFKTL
jgi:small-conductance mechanosensitive channel/CRP-like cAMP-binding protein